MKESMELQALESTEPIHAAVSAERVEVKTETAVSKKEKISMLKEEIEQIKLADSKVANGQYWGISKESIADDVHMAGQSVAEREAAIRSLKQEGATQKKALVAKSNSGRRYVPLGIIGGKR